MAATQIVGFVGLKGSGKDTAANYLEKNGYSRAAYADPLRDVVVRMFQLQDPKYLDGPGKEEPGPLGVSYREGMQVVGTDFVREQLKDRLPNVHGKKGEFWLEHMKATIERCAKEGKNLAITDVRFENEAEQIISQGGLLLFVYRPPEILKEFYGASGWKAGDAHPSETGVGLIRKKYESHANFRFLVNDSTIEELHQKVRWALRSP